MTRGPSRPGPGEGVGGGVNPSPKGKKGVGRGSALDHLRPKGLVGLLICPTVAVWTSHPLRSPDGGLAPHLLRDDVRGICLGVCQSVSALLWALAARQDVILEPLSYCQRR